MTKLHRIVARMCAAALLTTGVAVVASASATAATGTSDITVYLAPPDPAGLASLAQATDLTHEERIARLQQLLPDPAPVAEKLASLGLTVTAEDTWSVSAKAPATTVADLFGTRPLLASVVGATLAQIRAATGSLPLLPSVLDGLVTAVMPSGGPATMRAHAAAAGVTYNGGQIRSAYNQPYDGSGSNPTVASIQFSNDPSLSSDLSTYASQNGISQRGQLATVTVGNGPADANGADEVSLDQEALLAVSPMLNQRAYFADAGNDGFLAAYNAVLNDVLNNHHSEIVALTSSWGQCESQIPAPVIAAAEHTLQSLVAAGVTVFGASGDNGIYDCGPPSGALCPLICPAPTVDVDYPASSPSVVAVGATKLTQSGSSWSETAWSCTAGTITLSNTNPDCYATGGSGGGASGMSGVSGDVGFDMPAYQKNNIFSSPFKSNPKRLVPDISALGDPSTGLNAVVGGQNVAVGGTSLSTPVAAGLFAGTLSHYGVQAGVGDIHNALYTATRDASASAFARDVLSGTNGSASDQRSDPSVTAGLGYDTVTGLGSVYWPTFAPWVITTVPTIDSWSLTSSGTKVTGSWKVSKAPKGAALQRVAVSITGPDGSTVVSIPDASPNATVTFPGIAGGGYTMLVTATDLLGYRASITTPRYFVPANAGGSPSVVTVSGPATVNIDDALLKGSGWKRVRTKGAFGGKVLKSSSRGRKVSVKVTAQTITLTFFAGPRNGRLIVLLDGKRIVIDQYSKRAVRKSVTLLAGRTVGTHTVQLISSGKRSPRSRGTSVDVDFLTAYLP